MKPRKMEVLRGFFVCFGLWLRRASDAVAQWHNATPWQKSEQVLPRVDDDRCAEQIADKHHEEMADDVLQIAAQKNRCDA